MVSVCSISWLCILKNGQKWPFSWGQENRMEQFQSHQICLFWFLWLKSRSFKFSNDTFITFEMSKEAYRMSVGKINISLLFRPSVIRGPWMVSSRKLHNRKQRRRKNFTSSIFSENCGFFGPFWLFNHCTLKL